MNHSTLQIIATHGHHIYIYIDYGKRTFANSASSFCPRTFRLNHSQAFCNSSTANGISAYNGIQNPPMQIYISYMLNKSSNTKGREYQQFFLLLSYWRLTCFVQRFWCDYFVTIFIVPPEYYINLSVSNGS